jgi:hypothetical protein
MSYVKLVPSILTSTVWSESPATKLTWLTMLVLADRDGLVSARAPGIARAAGLPVEDVRAALAIFAAPDADSRTRDFDGRRIKDTEDGILILNYEKYRDTANREEREEKARARAARSYARKTGKSESGSFRSSNYCSAVCRESDGNGCAKCPCNQPKVSPVEQLVAQ